MRVRILGSAAGGGLPQWNCRCANCEAVRVGSPGIQARTQSSVAISADNRWWFLLNVSADVRREILAFPDLWPPAGNPRGTTIAGCLLTDSEIDHTSGLLQLREGCQFSIFSTAVVRRWLTEYLPISTVLTSFADRPWRDLPLGDALELPLPSGQASGLQVRAFEVGNDTPRFVPRSENENAGAVIGLQIDDTVSGGKLVYAPGVSAITPSLEQVVRDADCILIDGTFWTDDEPIRLGISSRTSREMGHLPVFGAGGTLNWLAGLTIPQRVFIHINNTNPMLNQHGPQWRQVNSGGVHIAADGDEFDV